MLIDIGEKYNRKKTSVVLKIKPYLQRQTNLEKKCHSLKGEERPAARICRCTRVASMRLLSRSGFYVKV